MTTTGFFSDVFTRHHTSASHVSDFLEFCGYSEKITASYRDIVIPNSHLTNGRQSFEKIYAIKTKIHCDSDGLTMPSFIIQYSSQIPRLWDNHSQYVWLKHERNLQFIGEQWGLLHWNEIHRASSLCGVLCNETIWAPLVLCEWVSMIIYPCLGYIIRFSRHLFNSRWFCSSDYHQAMRTKTWPLVLQDKGYLGSRETCIPRIPFCSYC